MASRPGAHDLTTGPIAKTLAVFALPTLASNILQSLNGSINAIWVGRLLGERVEHRLRSWRVGSEARVDHDERPAITEVVQHFLDFPPVRAVAVMMTVEEVIPFGVPFFLV